MALLDSGLKQRIVGALVLLALMVIFLPMLLSRQDDLQRVVVDAPAMPQAPVMPQVELDPVSVPQAQSLPEEPVPMTESEIAAAAPAVAVPAKPVAAVTPPAATKPSVAEVAAPASRLDANGLSVSWSIQLASLSSRTSADSLQNRLRGAGYNAYVRNVEGMNRVFVGPVIERAEADRLRDQLTRQQKLNGFVVRFQPERG
ncbi:MAG: SPOR domain-containing protein [Pseudomonas sp.]|uniref:SPOR domain-containing protein n=1 Tax=Pseudomonas sp. TaxID=306 RepID=UPI0027371F61|nr:SPOR domain-containing protein [Pseudomonas sp.]MDP3844856.1 SPOR domain-containing protein [Pseudomonas sp.]